jgi:hypothetical protein
MLVPFVANLVINANKWLSCPMPVTIITGHGAFVGSTSHKHQPGLWYKVQ